MLNACKYTPNPKESLQDSEPSIDTTAALDSTQTSKTRTDKVLLIKPQRNMIEGSTLSPTAALNPCNPIWVRISILLNG
jgi:hypothetical protein